MGRLGGGVPGGAQSGQADQGGELRGQRPGDGIVVDTPARRGKGGHHHGPGRRGAAAHLHVNRRPTNYNHSRCELPPSEYAATVSQEVKQSPYALNPTT